MTRRFNLLVLPLLLAWLFINKIFAASKSDAQLENPIFIGHNEIFQFDKTTADHIKQATAKTIEETKKSLQKIYALEKGTKNTMVAYDDALDGFSTVYAFTHLMANPHPDGAIRDTANVCRVTMLKFYHEIGLD